MHLKQLKLAGFKSFVDPTVMSFPSQLVGVVGPNGCGKSNIIDAVRWVMGESHAKNLRGESMTDVIFSGSSQRKAVGQASVELVFDNSFGRFVGQYASYQEIAVKRLVTRDGESSYYLNGSRCRRRDITDLFLGTGAGARGYSIIGQGTISRLVEARPEELKAYLEEAAGVSKYKERRRETLSRITQTRENLARLADIRGEIDKQLQRLERQAKTAEKYKTLKAEERLCKAEILALKWRVLTEEQITKQNELKRLVIDYESYQAKVTEAYKKSTFLREKHQQDQDIFQKTQTHFYQLTTEIVRLEESTQQIEREKNRLRSDQQHLQSDWQTAVSQLQQDKKTQQESEVFFARVQNELHAGEQDWLFKKTVLQEAQQQHANWHAGSQQVQVALSNALRDVEVSRVQLQAIEQRRQQTVLRLEKIKDEQRSVDLDELSQNLKDQQTLLNTAQVRSQQDEAHYQQQLAQKEQLRQQLTDTEKKLHQASDYVHQTSTHQAMLRAAQHSALGKTHGNRSICEKLNNKPRWVENLCVEPEWQFACEWVLGEGLQALLLDSWDEFLSNVHDLHGYSALIVPVSQEAKSKAAYPRLFDKIKGTKPNWTYPLDKIYAAATVHEAMSWLPGLNEEESIITPDGHWIGKGWIRVASLRSDAEIGLLSRQAELTQCSAEVDVARERLTALKNNRDQLHTQLEERELQLDAAKQNLLTSRETVRTYTLEISKKESILLHEQAKQNNLVEEAAAFMIALEELAIEQMNKEEILHAALQHSHQNEQKQNQIMSEKEIWEELLTQNNQRVEEARTHLHDIQLQCDRERLKSKQLNEQIAREESRVDVLNQRLEQLLCRLTELEAPSNSFDTSLAEKNQQRSQLEAELNVQREELADLTKELENQETDIKIAEKHSKTVLNVIQQEQMQEQSLAVRAAGVIESLVDLERTVDELLVTLPPDASQSVYEQKLQRLVDQIKQLGAINLAAIEEYDNELQRKHYLDKQYQDLIDALALLEAAIEKMDKETQSRLQTTFDEVNAAFQALFPRLFGGGRARLELTCGNLLEAGIVVMAQPPGKRNATIHLLSGGEKAMTAVALVFAIFQLNPSPFCLLDEVDAPLDDVNVGRFCDLVKEMSQVVQFLFITHNKIAMQLADHLIGVTMHEPGVSRMVAVDIEQVLSMSETIEE